MKVPVRSGWHDALPHEIENLWYKKYSKLLSIYTKTKSPKYKSNKNFFNHAMP